MSNTLKEFRCKYCNKLFFKGDLKHCVIEVKCKNCKEYNIIKGKNCQLLFLLDKQEPLKEKKPLSKKDINKAVQKCSECKDINDCDYYKLITEINVCPFCKKDIKK